MEAEIVYTVKRKDGKNQNLTTLEQHFDYILNWCNFNFYNVNETFYIQLFDKEHFATDQVDCTAKFQGESIASVISQAIHWIDERHERGAISLTKWYDDETDSYFAEGDKVIWYMDPEELVGVLKVIEEHRFCILWEDGVYMEYASECQGAIRKY